jgi:hypothetical protein
MPVVRRSDGNGVDGLVFKRVPQIRIGGRPPLSSGKYVGDRFLEDRIIHVAHSCDLDVGHAHERVEVLLPAASQAGTRHAHRLVWA